MKKIMREYLNTNGAVTKWEWFQKDSMPQEVKNTQSTKADQQF